MKLRVIFAVVLFKLITLPANSQSYFPPVGSNTWDTISPSGLGWCQHKIDSLYQFLEVNSTKAFILLKDGKIVLEQYFNGHSAEASWYWASAGKTLTAFLVGIAQQENSLLITDTSSTWLGTGWTSCNPAQEEKITIRHQLTMTSGLNDTVEDPYCTIDTCLRYLAEAGTRWAYHNAPYTLLDEVLQNSTGLSMNQYVTQKVKIPTGMDGIYLPSGYNNVFFSTARSMARFGLLILNEGHWDGNQILTDTAYFREMVNTSQNFNKSYGYLWWLNGKESFMVPQMQFVFPGSLNPSAPDDMISAMGKDGQFLNVVPSLGMVWIRMGEAPGSSLVPFTFNEDIWKYINELDCHASSVSDPVININTFTLSGNPVKEVLRIRAEVESGHPCLFRIYHPSGPLVREGEFSGMRHSVNVSSLSSGLYIVELITGSHHYCIKFVKE